MAIEVSSLEQAEKSTRRDTEEYKYWQEKPLYRLIAFIVNRYHYSTRQELARLDRLFAKVCSIHAQNHSELRLIRRLFRDLSQEITAHMLEEEQTLFPRIILLEESVNQKGSLPKSYHRKVEIPIQMKLADETALELLREIHSKCSNFTPPPDACISYQALYKGLQALEQELQKHIHLENDILFPRVLDLENSVRSGAEDY